MKKQAARKAIRIFLAITLAIIGLVLLAYLLPYLDEQAEADRAADKIAEEQRAAAQEENEKERLEAVSKELGIDTKYILPDGVEVDFWDFEQKEYYYRAEKTNYLVIFDENNEIKTIIENTEYEGE